MKAATYAKKLEAKGIKIQRITEGDNENEGEILIAGTNERVAVIVQTGLGCRAKVAVEMPTGDIQSYPDRLAHDLIIQDIATACAFQDTLRKTAA